MLPALACLVLLCAAFALPAHAAAVAGPAAAPAAAASGSAIPGALDRAFGQIAGAQSGGSLSLSLQLLLIMGLLTILPSLVLMMTSFTRILVVLAILRPTAQEQLTLDDLAAAFNVIAEMIRRDSDRLPSASVSFLGARSNRLTDSRGREPSLESVLRGPRKCR
jgi:hypothetical protein